MQSNLLKVINDMKKGIILLLLFISYGTSFAQTAPGINFQAVARDQYGNPAKDRNIFVETSILQTSATGTILLQEEFTTNTDNAGVFNVKLGQGKRLSGTKLDLQSIDWGNGPFFLNIKVAISPMAPVSGYDYTKDLIDLGSSPFGSVPYALFAGAVLGFEKKLNANDTVNMLAPYAKDAIVKNITTILQNKLDTATVLKLLEPYALKAVTLDSIAVMKYVTSKVNVADSITKYVTPTQLAAKTFDSTAIYDQLSKKEIFTNKSTNITQDATSDSKYPSVKAVKSYVDGQIAIATIADADATTKGKLALSGDLSGTAASPLISNNAITTAKITPNTIHTHVLEFSSTSVAVVATAPSAEAAPSAGAAAAGAPMVQGLA